MNGDSSGSPESGFWALNRVRIEIVPVAYLPAEIGVDIRVTISRMHSFGGKLNGNLSDVVSIWSRSKPPAARAG